MVVSTSWSDVEKVWRRRPYQDKTCSKFFGHAKGNICLVELNIYIYIIIVKMIHNINNNNHDYMILFLDVHPYTSWYFSKFWWLEDMSTTLGIPA